MEHAEKFALIPEEFLSKHVPSTQQMSEFDLAMSKILNSSLPDHEKVKQYYELLQRKMNLEEFNSPWKPIPKQEEKLDEAPAIKHEPQQEYSSIMLSTVPRNMRPRAEELLHFLKSQPNVFTWTPRGEVTYKGQKLENSNLADFLNLIFSPGKKSTVKGQKEMLRAFKELGVPDSMIRNKLLLSQPLQNVTVSPRNVTEKRFQNGGRQNKMKSNIKPWIELKIN